MLVELGLTVPPLGSRHIRRSLYEQLRIAILEGRLASGVRLPADRDLAAEFGVSRNTAVSVYKLLANEGLVHAHIGAGTFVAPNVQRSGLFKSKTKPNEHWIDPVWATRPVPGTALPANIVYDLRLGFPDISTFPFDVWRRLHGRALRNYAQQDGKYRERSGLEALRKAIATHVSATRMVACGADDIVVTAGAQQAFDLLARVFITPKRCMVAMEDPGYPFARLAFAAAGARIAPVPVDQEGLIVDQLPREATLIYVTPSHQLPSGVTLSARRRRALLNFAAERGAVIVEDDYDGEFRFLGRPLDALQTLDTESRVFYVGTFSKSMFSSLRLGYIVAPEWAHGALARARQISDGSGSVIEQATLAAFINEGHLAQHVRRLRKIYDKKRVVLLESLHKHCRGLLQPVSATGGLHVAAYAPNRRDTDKVLKRVAHNGIAVSSIASYAVNPKHAAPGFALGIGLIPLERIEPGIAALAKALRIRR